jgi:hypothetical protein
MTTLAPILSLFSRSLMLRTRSGAVAWMRLGVGVGLAGALWAREWGDDSAAAGAGGVLLWTIALISVCALGYAVLAACAGAITEEKEQNTFGLLLMTGLSPTGILLAKAGGRLVEALLLLAITLPAALVAVALGGVTAAQVYAVYANLGGWLLLMAAVGLCWSVWLRSSGAALCAAVGTVGAVALILCIQRPWVAAVADYSESGRLGEIFAVSAATPPVFGWADGCQVALAAVLFVVAWACLPRGDCVAAVAAKPVVERGPTARSGLRPRWGWRPRAGLRALAWKEFRYTCGGWPGVLANLALAEAIALGWHGWMDSWYFRGQYAWSWLWDRNWSHHITVVAAVMLAWRIGYWLARGIGGELRQDTFDDLCTLPMGLARVLAAKWGAVVLAGVPLAVVVALGTWELHFAYHPITLFFGDEPRAPAAAFLCGALCLWTLSLLLALTFPRLAGIIATSLVGITVFVVCNLDQGLRGIGLTRPDGAVVGWIAVGLAAGAAVAGAWAWARLWRWNR